MVSEDGHLIFSTGDHKDIRFQTTGSGSVKVGTEDLTKVLDQVSPDSPVG